MSDYPIDFLIKCDEAYHNGETPLVSDIEYDLYKTESRKDHPTDPYFDTVGATPTSGKVELPYTLGSLSKMKYDGSMRQWASENPDIITLAVSDKLDGCTIYVEYNEGKVVFASTRGDGYIGHNITEKAKVFCPEIDYQYPIHLKGEVLATTQVAKDLGYKKSRTFVAGCLNRDGIKNSEHLEVVFYLFLNEGYPTYEDHIKGIEAIGLPAVHFARFDAQIPNIEDVLAEYYGDRKAESRWDIDGLVCVDNHNPNHQDEYYPDNAVAFKVNEDAVRTTVTAVFWEVKRSGKMQPVVHIEPVDISGSEVTKCTGFNMKYIRDNEIGEGSEIGIVLSGEIIPYITDVYTPTELGSIPYHCPSCDAKLGVSASGVDLICLNPDCEGKMVYRLENFLLSNDVEEVTATTIRKMGVSSFIELMELDEFDLTGIEGFGASRVSTIINQIKKVYSTTPANLLKSFGITGLGKTMSAEIVLKFSDMDTIFQAGWLDFIEMDGIGEVMANRILNELPEYKETYDYLVENGLTFKEAEGDALKGKKITLTGKSEIKRNDLKKAIEAQGGMVKGISQSVDYLFTNSPESTTSKMKKAQAYGITIMGYDKLYELLGMSV